MTALAVFSGGLLLLLVAANRLVVASAALGARLGFSPMVIGLTIVAAGTSAPELAVVGQAVAAADTELAVGSIVGSNIANVLLVLGTAAIIGTIDVTARVVRLDIPVMIGASALLLVFALDGVLGRLDGLIMLSGLVAFIAWTVRSSRRTRVARDPAAPTLQARGGRPTRPAAPHVQARMSRLVAELVIGVVGLAVASRFVVSGAETIATALGVPELLVGLTIVALGTSAPEIATTLVAARRGESDLAVGNAVGSNIFNILLVLGSAGLLAPAGVAISDDVVELDLPILLAAAIACLPVVGWDHRLARWEGAVFVFYYAAYLLFITLDATGHGVKEPMALVLVGFVMPLTVVTFATVIHRGRATRRAAPETVKVG